MPKPYIRKMPATWWLRKRAYFWFMLRELTAVFVAAYCVLLLILLWQLRQAGNTAEARFQGPEAELSSARLNAQASELERIVMFESSTPWTIALHLVVLVFAVYHSVTWFNLTPQIMVIRMGEEKLPPIVLLLGNYLFWFAVSGLLIWLVIWR